ncbi:hypothetical protein KCU88_g157, partial [Aureobasidium melanogenum]
MSLAPSSNEAPPPPSTESPSQSAMLEINARIKFSFLNQGNDFVQEILWASLLDHALGADFLVDVGEQGLQIDVQEIVGAVGLENVEALIVFACTEGLDGAADVRFELKKVAEIGIVQHLRLEFRACHGSQSTESAVDGDIVAGDDLTVAVSQAGFRVEEADGSIVVITDRHLLQTHGCVDFGLVSGHVFRFHLQVADLVHLRLDGQPVLLFNSHSHNPKCCRCNVRCCGTVIPHASSFPICARLSVQRHSRGERLQTHTYALFDEVVLVPLQFVLQTGGFGRISLFLLCSPDGIHEIVHIFAPGCLLQQCHCFVVVSHIAALLGLRDRHPSGFFLQRDRT